VSKFKVGDRVRCVDEVSSTTGLTYGGIYEVSDVGSWWVQLAGAPRPTGLGWDEMRFELVERDVSAEPIKKLLDAGLPDFKFTDPPLRNMHSEETRVTSDTGASTGVKKARYDQIPTWPLYLLACKYGAGNDKYPQANGIDNWRNGYEWSKAYAKLQRHANQFWSGEDVDPDSGELHLVAVIWHAMALIEWGSRPELAAKFDDRQDKINPMEER